MENNTRLTRVADNADGDAVYEVEVVTAAAEGQNGIAKGEDPFELDEDGLKKMRGLSPTFRRKVSRDISKLQDGLDGARTKQQDWYSMLGYSTLGVVTPPYNLDYLAQLYDISAAHKAAVDAKVANIVGLGYDWIESPKTQTAISNLEDQTKVDKARKKISAAKINLNDWLDACNNEETFIETLSRVWTDVETTGNGYLEIGRMTNGEIGYFGHIPSSTMRVRSERDGFVQIIGRYAVFFRNYGDQTTANPIGDDTRPNEIIQFKNFSPTNQFYGVPDIMSAKNALAGAEFAARFNLDYFEYKAVPRYIITLKGAQLSALAEQKLIQFFQTGLKGANHRTMYVPLPGGDNVEFKMEPVESGTQEGSFDNYMKATRDEILMAHRVPISKVSLSEGQALAAARDADKGFKESVCAPRQAILNKKINKIIAEKTDAMLFKLNELTLTDEQTQAKIDEVYSRVQAITPNEIRARKGQAGLPDGDKPAILSAGQVAQQTARSTGNAQRAQDRAATAPDTTGEARNEQGAGRQVK